MKMSYRTACARLFAATLQGSRSMKDMPQLSISPPEEDEAFRERICWKEDICHLCGPMLRCTTCGNNCCNGGSGEVNGDKCPDCPRVYEEMKRRDAASLCQSHSRSALLSPIPIESQPMSYSWRHLRHRM